MLTDLRKNLTERKNNLSYSCIAADSMVNWKARRVMHNFVKLRFNEIICS